MSTPVKIEGFVLKKIKLLGTDVLVVVFTEDQGKIAAVAKGLRQFVSRRAPHLQSGNLIKASIRHSNGRQYIESTDLISGFVQLRKQTYVNSIYLALSLIDSLLPEGQCESEVYQSLKIFFKDLHRNGDQQAVMRNFLQQVLSLLGYVDEEKNLDDLINLAEENTGTKLPLNVII